MILTFQKALATVSIKTSATLQWNAQPVGILEELELVFQTSVF